MDLIIDLTKNLTTDLTAPSVPPKKATLAELREKLGAITKLDSPPGWTVGDFLPPPVQGKPIPGTHSLILPQGALVEWVGESAESALCQFFRRHSETQIAWIEKRLRIFPPAFSQRGVSLKRMLFIESVENWQWSLHQCLRSGTFQFVVVAMDDFPTQQLDLFLRKCQLLSERSRTTLCLIARTPITAYSIRYHVNADSHTQAHEKALPSHSL